nr:hypothetical protein [Candidatus Njordarchaeum guaymaensis]
MYVLPFGGVCPPLRKPRGGTPNIHGWMKPAAPADERRSVQACCGKPAAATTTITRR